MEKFPMLQLYRAILSAAGYLIMLGGILAGLLLANSGRGFNFGTFLGIAFGGLVLGGSTVITAEFIQVFLSMEDHLDRISRTLERNATHVSLAPSNQLETSLTKSNVSNVHNPPKQPVKTVKTDYISNVNPTSGMHTVEVHPLDRVLIRRMPQGSVIAVTVPTQTLTALGRTADSSWIKVRKDLEDNEALIGWVERDQVTSYEDISLLPVIGESV